jgi:isopenicillin-N N-acyltransferase-like protein
LMMDHVNYPLSICRHLSEKANSLSESKTISSIIMQPKKARILVQPGNPCKNAGYTEYKMPR